MRDNATEAQVRAARPDASTWLNANAGSGKTRVLTDRVARLLLNGTPPERILCLTYTKAAASEMQNRLFRRLGAWAMLNHADLRAALEELGLDPPFTDDRLRTARRLFAMAIETPGGLKIQTIHSFCAALLRRFPLEAGVSPQFQEMEDRAADLLRADILDEMADGPNAEALAQFMQLYTGAELPGLTKAVAEKREAFDGDLSVGDLLEALDERRDLSRDSVLHDVFLGNELSIFAELIPSLLVSKPSDQKVGHRLSQIKSLDWDSLVEFESMFLYGSDAKESPLRAKTDRVPTKLEREAIPGRYDALHAFMLRVENARPKRLALINAERSMALYHFARAFLTRYHLAKQARGWLDFDDLILKTVDLLRDSRMAAWVLYRIDGGIDHILVDEAQDTSARQWEVIAALVREFTSGETARADVARTLFVVGDKKQSIYSFQGADPMEFDRRRDRFQTEFSDAQQPFQRRSLDYSFRSASAILRLVDTVFDPRRRPDFDKQTEHIPFKEQLPGRVDLWPLISEEDKLPENDWFDPVDRQSPRRANSRLAEKIAAQIKAMLDEDNPTFIPDEGKERGTLIRRPVRPGDFLILVKRRSDLFAEIIRACKAANLPIAGADVLKVGGEMAVKDLAALLRFLATPDDDLSLAVALKSPLFGWDEQQLFSLAHGRGGARLWEVLRQSKGHDATLAVLDDLRRNVDFLRPYDLIDRILTRHDGRRLLLGRLGPEAEDGINALLSQALGYERGAVPSLTGFLEWLETDDVTVKRQVDAASNQIRVMTVHGAKGLEAPIVILPETQKRTVTVRQQILEITGVPVWKSNAGEQHPVIADRVQQMKEAEEAERLRLLYVALTRAEKWLIVAAAGKVSEDQTGWYQIIEEAMKNMGAVPFGTDGALRAQSGDWDGLPVQGSPLQSSESPVLEPFFADPPAIFAHPTPALSPSDLGGAKVVSGDAGGSHPDALTFGTLVHEVLERVGTSPDVAALKSQFPSTSELDQAFMEVATLVERPELAHIFGQDTLVEVPITGEVAGAQVTGIIDRLVVSDTEVICVDYKTNRAVPGTAKDCPEGLLRQMAAYHALLCTLYPDRKVTAALLWTANATLMPLPEPLMAAALARSPYLDAVGGHS